MTPCISQDDCCRNAVSRLDNLDSTETSSSGTTVQLFCMGVLCCWSVHMYPLLAAEGDTDDSMLSGSTSGAGEDESASDSADSGLADFVAGTFDGQEEVPGHFAPEMMEQLAMSPLHPM